MQYLTYKTETGGHPPHSLYRPREATQLLLFQPEPVDPAAEAFRTQVLQLESALLEQPPVTFDTTHHFFPGLYAREFFQPKGTVVTSKIHRHPYLLVLAYGAVRMRTEQGIDTYHGPMVMPTFAGVKRALFTLEDCLFISAHPTDKTDLAAIEDDLIVTDPQEWAELAVLPRPALADWSALPVVEENDE